MNTPATLKAPPEIQRKFAKRLAIGTFAIVFPLWLLVVIITTFLLPNTYVSTTHIQLNEIGTNTSLNTLRIQQDAILAWPVLEKVIDKLNLNQKWGDQYFGGNKFRTDETYEILKARLTAEATQNPMLIAVNAYDATPQGAAQIANTVADMYQEWTQTNEAEISKPTATQFVANPVQIIDRAVPATRHCKPNRPLNIVLGALAAIIFGAMAGGLAYSISWLLGLPISWSRSKQDNPSQNSIRQKY